MYTKPLSSCANKLNKQAEKPAFRRAFLIFCVIDKAAAVHINCLRKKEVLSVKLLMRVLVKLLSGMALLGLLLFWPAGTWSYPGLSRIFGKI